MSARKRAWFMSVLKWPMHRCGKPAPPAWRHDDPFSAVGITPELGGLGSGQVHHLDCPSCKHGLLGAVFYLHRQVVNNHPDR